MVIKIQPITVKESKRFDKDQTERETIECIFICYEMIVNDREVRGIKREDEDIMLREG